MKLDVLTFERSTHTAEEAAAAVGAEVGQIVKSLVFVADRDDGPEPCLVLVSGANTVDLAVLANALTEPRMRRATADEAHDFTGFAIGGIPPFGYTRPIRTVMDPDLGRFATVWAAAGTPNAVFAVTPQTLRVLANAIVTPIADAPETGPSQQPANANQRVTAPRTDADRLSVQYPGGLAARYRWTGSGGGPGMFAISEAIGMLTDHGPLVGPKPDAQCRAELRVEGPTAGWTARFASPIFDEPRTRCWSTRKVC